MPGSRARDGDPRRVVGAYITDVEKTEEKALAASDARAQEQASEEPAPAEVTGAGDVVDAASAPR